MDGDRVLVEASDRGLERNLIQPFKMFARLWK
jgi:hypothetical protein